MKNHKKAREFCKREIYIEEGVEEDLIETITEKILKAPGNYSLKNLMKGLGREFAHGEETEAIGILEATYTVLGQKRIKQFIQDNKLDFTDQDDYFEIIFNHMYDTAKEYRKEDLLLLLETYLEPEKHKKELMALSFLIFLMSFCIFYVYTT